MVVWLCESSGYEHCIYFFPCYVVICCIYTSYCDTICNRVEKYVYGCGKTKTLLKSITPFCNAGSNAEVFDGVLEIVQGVCVRVSTVLCCCCARNSASLDRGITGILVCMGILITLFDIIKMILEFSTDKMITDETKCELIGLGIIMILWCWHAVKESHSVNQTILIPCTLMFAIAQLLVRIIKHIAIVKSLTLLDDQECLFL